MVRTIKAGKRLINIKACAAVLILYKQQFGREYTEDYESGDPVVTGINLVWCMAKCADESIPDPENWLKELGTKLDIMEAVSTASALMYESMGEYTGGDTETTDPNLSERLTAAALKCGFSVADLRDVSISFLLTSISEHIDMDGGKKKESGTKTARKATEDDVNKLISLFKRG